MAFLTSLSSRIRNARGAGGDRGDQDPLVPPVFGRSVNPIPTRGADYAHHITTIPPRFFDGAASLPVKYRYDRDVVKFKYVGVGEQK